MRLQVARRPLLLLLLCGIAARVGLVLWARTPAVYDDTGGYVILAEMLRSGDFTGYNGFRTPTYPLLMLLCGGNATALFGLHLLLGLATTWILYEAFRLLSGSRKLGFAAGMAHNVNLSALVYEANLLTETSTTFLVALTLWGTFALTAAWRAGRPLSGWRACGIGLAASLAALDRPLCVVLPLLLLLFLAGAIVRGPAAARRSLGRAGVAAALPMLLLLGGWSAFNLRTTGTFSLTTLTGFNLTHWSGAYIASAPAEFAPIAAIYTPYLEQSGTSHQTIWQARAALEEHTGLTTPQLSKLLQRMSLAIIRANPGAYVRGVCRSWIDFWRPSLLRHGVNLQTATCLAFRLAFVLVEVAFLLGPLLWLASRRFRTWVRAWPEFLLLYVFVHATALVQAVLISVENPRYSVPVDPWILGTGVGVASLVWRLARAWPRPLSE